MKPPRLPSPFRNVRSTPRNFTFRSSHVDARAMRWKERKEAIEAEVNGTTGGTPKKLRFRQAGATGGEREGRLASLMINRHLAA